MLIETVGPERCHISKRMQEFRQMPRIKCGGSSRFWESEQSGLGIHSRKHIFSIELRSLDRFSTEILSKASPLLIEVNIFHFSYDWFTLEFYFVYFRLTMKHSHYHRTTMIQLHRSRYPMTFH